MRNYIKWQSVCRHGLIIWIKQTSINHSIFQSPADQWTEMGKEQEPEWVKNERVAFTKWRDMNKVCLVYVGKVEYGKLVTFLCMTM